MKNKSVITEIFAFVVSFFLFTFNVKADTTFNISSNAFPLLDNLPTMKATADTYLSTLTSDYKGYIIYYQGVNPVATYALFFKNDPTIRYDFWNNANMYGIYGNNYNTKTTFSSDFTSLSTATFNYFHPYFDYNGNNPFYILYSTTDLFPNAGATLNEYVIFNYDGRSYSFYNDGTNSFPTLEDLYIYFSISPDNTPLLSSFVTLVVEKLAYMCEFFTSSYIYLSMFVIFILYFVIFLFRRVKNV